METKKIDKVLNLLWFKKSSESMEQLDYALRDLIEEDESVFPIKSEEFDVFMEHEYNAEQIASGADEVIILPSSQSICKGEDCDGDDERDGNEGLEEDNDDEEVDRPKEDEEPKMSEDERPVQQPEETGNDRGAVQEEEETGGDDLPPGSVDPEAPDDGDEVVRDEGDGGDDDRFKQLFEEGERNRVTEENTNRGHSDDDGEDTDPEFGLGDEVYLDTPLESEEEWAQWDYPKKSR